MQSICDQLLFEEARKERNMKKIKFIWTDRDPVMMVEAPVVRRMKSVDAEMSTIMGQGSVDTTECPDYFSNDIKSAQIFSHLKSLLAAGDSIDDDDLDEFYDYMNDIMDQDAESLLQNDNFPLSDEDLADDMISVVDNHAPWDRDPESNKTLGEILEMQLFHTGAQSGILIPYARQGRPDIKKIFLEMKQEAKEKGEQRVAVCVCAPKKLSALCQKACIVYSDKDVCFDFHAESMGA